MDYQNRPQLQATGRYRTADDLIAADERGAGLTFQFGFPILKQSNDLAAWIKDHKDDRPHSFAFELSWLDKDAIDIQGHTDLSHEAYDEIKGSANWTTKVAKEKMPKINGLAVGADQSLTVSYLDPSGVANDRFIVTESLTLHLDKRFSVPLSISWANEQEFLDEDHVVGRIGVSFSLDRVQNAGK